MPTVYSHAFIKILLLFIQSTLRERNSLQESNYSSTVPISENISRSQEEGKEIGFFDNGNDVTHLVYTKSNQNGRLRIDYNTAPKKSHTSSSKKVSFCEVNSKSTTNDSGGLGEVQDHFDGKMASDARENEDFVCSEKLKQMLHEEVEEQEREMNDWNSDECNILEDVKHECFRRENDVILTDPLPIENEAPAKDETPKSVGFKKDLDDNDGACSADIDRSKLDASSTVKEMRDFCRKVCVN